MTAVCPWVKNDLALAYHDAEWGVPRRDDAGLFEFLVLEGAQAGLSWDTILRKRGAYREAFAGFDMERVARFTAADEARLLADAGIVRNRLKVRSAVLNARAALRVAEEFGSLGALLWQFPGVDAGFRAEVGGEARAPMVHRWREMRDVPASTAASDAMSRELKRRGFGFVGTTICYAFMQAVGMVNDHLATCPRWGAVQGG